MFSTTALAGTAALVGDPARANMLLALLDGRALTASELARAAGVTPQTASGHLARLATAGLVTAHPQGRHRYHRLASPAVAHLLENLMEVSQGGPGRALRQVHTGPRDEAMRNARTCYDHLAGRLGVALANALSERGQIELSEEGGAITEAGLAFFRDLGVALDRAPTGGKRVFCRPCLDWSERRLHVGGTLGAALATRLFALGWIARMRDTRAVSISPSGRRGLAERFGVSL